MTHPAACLQGPGEYYLRAGIGGVGGSWGRTITKTQLDWEIMRARQMPGPGEYNVESERHVKACARGAPGVAAAGAERVCDAARCAVLAQGGSWGKSSGKSDVEWQIYRASQMPGPTDYSIMPLSRGFGAKIGEQSPMSDIDLKIKKASMEPVRGGRAPRVITASHSARRGTGTHRLRGNNSVAAEGEAGRDSAGDDPEAERAVQLQAVLCGRCAARRWRRRWRWPRRRRSLGRRRRLHVWRRCAGRVAHRLSYRVCTCPMV